MTFVMLNPSAALIQEAEFAGYDGVNTGPHEFVPLKRWRNRGRCRHCLAHEDLHPTRGWLPSRPLFDERAAINPSRVPNSQEPS